MFSLYCAFLLACMVLGVTKRSRLKKRAQRATLFGELFIFLYICLTLPFRSGGFLLLCVGKETVYRGETTEAARIGRGLWKCRAGVYLPVKAEKRLVRDTRIVLDQLLVMMDFGESKMGGKLFARCCTLHSQMIPLRRTKLEVAALGRVFLKLGEIYIEERSLMSVVRKERIMLSSAGI